MLITPLVIIIILIPMLGMILYIAKRKGDSGNRLDKVGKITNFILTILYVPLSLFSFLLTMASETTIGMTDYWYIVMTNVFTWFAGLFPVVCIVCLFLSVRLRNKGLNKLSFVIQFLPLVLFGLNMIYSELLDHWFLSIVRK